MELGVSEGEAGFLRIYNAQGHELLTAGQVEDDTGALSLYNGQGRLLIKMGANDAGNGFLTTFNKTGEVLVKLGSREGKGFVMICDEKGKLQLVAGNDDGQPRILFFNNEEEIAHRLP